MKKSSALFLAATAFSLASCLPKILMQSAKAQNAAAAPNTTASNTTASNTTASNTTASNTTASNTTASNTTTTTAATKPNIILIVSDDQGYRDVGFNGCPDFKTPNIDALAASGTICTQGYVTFSVCSPSRAGFISGRHGARMGYDTNADGDNRTNPMIGLPLSERTIGDSLKGMGYSTGVIGKWHLGSQSYFHPNKRGFDEFFGFLRGGHNYWGWTPTPPAKREEAINSQWGDYSAPLLRNSEEVPGVEKRYLTDVLTDEAVSFVDRHKNSPFFLYLAYNAPHEPLQASPNYLARVPNLKGKRQTYAAMVTALDDGVGRVRAKLKELNLENNTLVYFVSDNGGSPENASDNRPLHGHKSDVWEGGVRVPYVVSWPGHVPAGKRYDKPVSTLDFYPTSLAVAGVDTTGLPGIEGVNVLPYLEGQNNGTPHAKLFWREFTGAWAVREGDWKLVEQPKGQRHLFNIPKDPSETKDLIKSQPQITARLLQSWREWNASNAPFIPWRGEKSLVASAPDED